jgi:hypothetical protein
MIGHYLLTAVRNIRRHRTNAALKFLALTFGLTCFLSAYVVSDYFANTDRQFANSDRIAVVRQKIIWPYSNIAFPFFVATAAPVAKYLKAEVSELPAVARRMSLGEIAVRTSAHKSYRQVQAVDADFLKIFGLPFVAGDAVDALASPKSAVISEEAANAIFGTKEVLGRRLTLQNQTDVTITGVTAAIKGPSHLSRTIASRPFDLLVSMDVGDALFPTVMGRPGSTTPWSELEDWTSNTFTTYALLPEGGTLSIRDLNARLQGFGARHIPISAGGGEFDAIPVSDYMLSRTDTLTLEDAFGLPLTTILYILGALSSPFPASISSIWRPRNRPVTPRKWACGRLWARPGARSWHRA